MIEKIAELVREKRSRAFPTCVTSPTARRPRGDRAEARCERRGRAEPALPFHADADSFGCNMLALNGGRPELMTLREVLNAFIDFREEVDRAPHQA
jgi:DNA gyrase subunit A